MDIFTEQKRSEIMSRIRSKGTMLEERGWSLLREAGVRFRKHPRGVYGHPDAVHKRKKIAVFFDSEFWHGYDWKNKKKDFKSRKGFWIAKIERNIQRDREVSRYLRNSGWKVIRIWERDIAKNGRKKIIESFRETWF